MKRRRSSLACVHQKSNEFEDKANNPQPEVQSLGPTITDLPFSITADILHRLPLKSVLICKCVCKTLRTLISDSEFAKLHFKRSPVAIMIRTNDAKRVSRNLHLLDFAPREFDPDWYCDYDRDAKDKYCGCDNSPMPDCQSHWLAEIKFKLPLRDVKMVLGSVLNSGRRRKYIACKPRDDKFGVVNSCNGLICLCDPKYRNPVVVCNPVTGEFIRLPEAYEFENLKDPIDSGFGFYAKANKYVVVRFCQYESYDGMNWRYVGEVAEMHILGTSTWESLGEAPYSSLNGWKFPTYLGGIYWLGFHERHIKIIFFHLESKKFLIVPSPPSDRYDDSSSSYRRDYICMGTLNGLLYISDSSSFRIRLWVKNHGVGSVWTKLFSIINSDGFGGMFWSRGLYRPLKLFIRDWVVVISIRNSLIYYDWMNGDVIRHLKVRGNPSRFDVFALKPCLVSMKEAVVMGDNVEIQNVYSRCGKLNLREDNEVLFVAEDIAKFETRTSPSGDEDDDSAEGFD